MMTPSPHPLRSSSAMPKIHSDEPPSLIAPFDLIQPKTYDRPMPEMEATMMMKTPAIWSGVLYTSASWLSIGLVAITSSAAAMFSIFIFMSPCSLQAWEPGGRLRAREAKRSEAKRSVEKGCCTFWVKPAGRR